MSYPPKSENGMTIGYRPTSLPLSIPEIESRLRQLVNGCSGQKVNSIHYTYWPHFSDVFYKEESCKLDGTIAVHHKTAIISGLLFSDEARIRQHSDPEFAKIVAWAQHAVKLASCIATSLRETLAQHVSRVEKLLETLATASSPGGRDPVHETCKSKRRVYTAQEQLYALREISAVLDTEEWKPLSTLSELSMDIFSRQTKTFPCLNPPGPKQHEFQQTAERELVSMLMLEGKGALSTDSNLGDVVKGLLCLTKMQSNVEGTLDAHGTNFWIIHVMQSSLCRNTSQFLVGNKLDFYAGRIMSQKTNRAAAAEIWGDIVRGMHNSIGQKVCCLVLKLIRGPLLKRYGEIRETHSAVHLREICTTFDTDFPERPSEKASDLQQLYNVDRHGSSDAKTRSGTESRQTGRGRPPSNSLDLMRCMPEKILDWCESIATDGKRSGIGLALDAKTTGPRISRLRRLLHTELLRAELNLAIADQYRTLYVEQMDIFEELYPGLKDDISKKNEFAGNSTIRLLRAPEEDEEGAPLQHRRIKISMSCFEMHACPENKVIYGTDDETPFPQDWVDANLVFSASSPQGVYNGSINELFGKNGTGGTHATPDDRGRFRNKQRLLLGALRSLEQTRSKMANSENNCAVGVPPILTAAAEEPVMDTIWPILEADAQLKDLHHECLQTVDRAVKVETSVRMATRITQAWTSMVETTRAFDRDSNGLIPGHNFTHYSFLFETICFAAIAPGGPEAMNEIVKIPVDSDGKAGFPQIVSPLNESTGTLSGWAERDWPTFCAIAESASRFFDKKSETFLSEEGSVVEITVDGRFVVNQERMARLLPSLNQHINDIKAVYGETHPSTLSDLCNLSLKSGASIGRILCFWLSWNDAKVAKKIVIVNGKEPFPVLPMKTRSIKTSSQPAKRAPQAVLGPGTSNQTSLSPMLLGAQVEEHGKAQLLELIKMSTILLRKLPSPAEKSGKKRKAETIVDEEMDEDELFGDD